MAAAGDHGPVRLAETHSAVVLLCGDRAYKWKKPVAFPFLDFRTHDQRAAACQRELELNRRLAPDVYLDVATLSGSDGSPLRDHTGQVLPAAEVRKELLDLEPGERAPVDAYTHDARTRVYEGLLTRARGLLARGEPVVLDASWTEPAWRDPAGRTAREASATPVAFLCQAPLAVAHDRVSRRAERAGEPSDATPEVLDRLAETSVPWPDAVRIDTTGEPDSVVGRAAELLRDRLRPRRV